MPKEDFNGQFWNENGRKDNPIYIGSYNDTDTIIILVDIFIQHISSKDTSIVQINLEFLGRRRNESLITYFIENPVIEVNNKRMNNQTRIKSHLNRSFGVFSGLYDQTLANYSHSFDHIMMNKVTYSIQFSVGLYYFDGNNFTLIDTIGNLTFEDYSKSFLFFERVHWINVSLILSVILLGSHALYLWRIWKDKLRINASSLNHLTILFPSLVVTFGALFFTPLTYFSYERFGKKIWFMYEIQFLIILFVFNVVYVLLFYFILPIMIDIKVKKRIIEDVENELNIHSKFLDRLEVSKESSYSAFFNKLRKNIAIRILVGGVMVPFVSEFIQTLLFGVLNISYLIMPIAYNLWIYYREDIFKGYRRKPK